MYIICTLRERIGGMDRSAMGVILDDDDDVVVVRRGLRFDRAMTSLSRRTFGLFSACTSSILSGYCRTGTDPFGGSFLIDAWL